MSSTAMTSVIGKPHPVHCIAVMKIEARAVSHHFHTRMERLSGGQQAEELHKHTNKAVPIMLQGIGLQLALAGVGRLSG